MSTIISFRHVTKIFESNIEQENDSQHAAHTEVSGRIYALDDVTFTTRQGEILGVLGPSGCGKSTLLRMAAGLESPTSGEVYYDTEPLRNIPMAERGIGMVFQSYALYPHLPSIDNIGFFLRLRRRETEIPERVREISRMMSISLAPILSRKPPTLSGGERQRVAIARCLARDPRVFLFDEPFSNLDAKLRTNARVELKRLLQKFKVTSIYVTHDQAEAIALCDRIAILNHGKLIQMGSYSHLYDTPRNIFVAGFLGSPAMNFFKGYAQDGIWVGKTFDWGPIRRDLNDFSGLVMGIRPEHITIGGDSAMLARVEHVEPLYGERAQIIYTRVESQRVAIRTTDELLIKPGERLPLSIMAQHVHFFDDSTGQRIA